MSVSNRKSLAKRVQRIFRVNDLHFPVADATRDLGIDAAGGARRRRSTRNQRLRVARRRGSRVKVLARKNRKAVKLHTTGIWPSITYGLEQYGLWPTDLKQFRATAATCWGVGGYQNGPANTIEIGMGQHQNPALQARLCIFSWWLRFWDENSDMHQPVQKAWRRVHSRLRGAKNRWGLVREPMSSVIATLMDLGWTPLRA